MCILLCLNCSVVFGALTCNEALIEDQLDSFYSRKDPYKIGDIIHYQPFAVFLTDLCQLTIGQTLEKNNQPINQFDVRKMNAIFPFGESLITTLKSSNRTWDWMINQPEMDPVVLQVPDSFEKDSILYGSLPNRLNVLWSTYLERPSINIALENELDFSQNYQDANEFPSELITPILAKELTLFDSLDLPKNTYDTVKQRLIIVAIYQHFFQDMIHSMRWGKALQKSLKDYFYKLGEQTQERVKKMMIYDQSSPFSIMYFGVLADITQLFQFQIMGSKFPPIQGFIDSKELLAKLKKSKPKPQLSTMDQSYIDETLFYDSVIEKFDKLAKLTVKLHQFNPKITSEDDYLQALAIWENLVDNYVDQINQLFQTSTGYSLINEYMASCFLGSVSRITAPYFNWVIESNKKKKNQFIEQSKAKDSRLDQSLAFGQIEYFLNKNYGLIGKDIDKKNELWRLLQQQYTIITLQTRYLEVYPSFKIQFLETLINQQTHLVTSHYRVIEPFQTFLSAQDLRVVNIEKRVIEYRKQLKRLKERYPNISDMLTQVGGN